ncbi:hypothetical protein ORJ04_11215 [Rheinheimera baltica]|uniref:Uncharacterized protein n=1 Tax=Rheinheimera baltica TaxID=67576 RepID=A0ABT9I0S2_9GAMM|nr:hypothetical protein [Rheinheimera baltica]MDP5136516.1 hypothetical protein [Rheinheimera baltica]
MDTVLVIIVFLFLAVSLIFSEALPKKYKDRKCEGRAWKKAYPLSPSDEIRSFLSVFVGAFAFNDQHKLKFNPNDKLIDIYKLLYPHKWQADVMEFETLADDLKFKYNLSFTEVWHDELTLGELFAKVQNA